MYWGEELINMSAVCHLEQKFLNLHFKRSLCLLESGFGGPKSGLGSWENVVIIQVKGAGNLA